MPPKSNPPTERQLKYAADLGILVPANADINDVSELISAAVNNDKPSTARHRAFAEHFRIKTTDYIGKKALFYLIHTTLANGERDRDLMAWFTYRVYRNLTNAADDAPIRGPGDPVIQAIAEALASDAKIVKSARRYDGADLIYFGEWTTPDGFTYTGGSKNTAAYKAAKSLIMQRVRLPDATERTSGKTIPRIQTAKSTQAAPQINRDKRQQKRRSYSRTIVRLIVWGSLVFIVFPIFVLAFISLLRK